MSVPHHADDEESVTHRILHHAEFVRAWDECMNQKGPEDIVIFLHRSQYDRHGCFSVMNKGEINVQARNWKTLIDDGKISKPLDCNCKTTTVGGKKYHYLTIQPTDPEHCDCDALAVFVLGFAVTGYVYVFEDEKTRDEIKNFLCA